MLLHFISIFSCIILRKQKFTLMNYTNFPANSEFSSSLTDGSLHQHHHIAVFNQCVADHLLSSFGNIIPLIYTRIMNANMNKRHPQRSQLFFKQVFRSQLRISTPLYPNSYGIKRRYQISY